MWSSPIISVDQYKYYLVLVDHYTRYTWCYPLKQKSQVRETFIAFKALVEVHFASKIRNLFSDNGGEFVALRSFLSEHGISHFTSPPHTPEHNGIAERKHRHIVETGLTLLHQASLPTKYWTYAFAVAVYLINRLPSQVTDAISPYAKLFGRPPNYLKLRVFGCLCFPWLRPYNTHKLQPRSLPCIFMGYSLTQSAYMCLHLPTGRLYVSRHVQFVENQFPYAAHKSSPAPAVEPSQPSFSPPTLVPLDPTSLVQPTSLPPPSGSPHLQHQQAPLPTGSVPAESGNEPAVGIDSMATSSSTSPRSSAGNSLNPLPPVPQTHPVNTTTTASSIPATTSVESTKILDNHHPMQTRAKNMITKPTKKLTLVATTSQLKPTIPTTLNQAM